MNKSLHYFNSFALQNRVDFSVLSNTRPGLSSSRHVTSSLLPSVEDDGALRANFITLVSRILVVHMPFFQFSFENVVDWHIKHKYYNEMCSKSVVVSP